MSRYLPIAAALLAMPYLMAAACPDRSPVQAVPAMVERLRAPSPTACRGEVAWARVAHGRVAAGLGRR